MIIDLISIEIEVEDILMTLLHEYFFMGKYLSYFPLTKWFFFQGLNLANDNGSVFQLELTISCDIIDVFFFLFL